MLSVHCWCGCREQTFWSSPGWEQTEYDLSERQHGTRPETWILCPRKSNSVIYFKEIIKSVHKESAMIKNGKLKTSKVINNRHLLSYATSQRMGYYVAHRSNIGEKLLMT